MSKNSRARANVNCREGYIALLSILIVASIAASTVLIIFITSLNTALNSGDTSRANTAKAMAEACAELALQRLTNGSANPCNGCPVTYPLAQGQCVIQSMVNTSGPNWQIRTTGTNTTGEITKYLEVTAVRSAPGAAATLSSWRELSSF